MNSLGDIVFTGTINLGTIVATLVAIGGGLALWLREKAATEKTRRIIMEENAKTRACIHKIPGHPENVKSPDISTS